MLLDLDIKEQTAMIDNRFEFIRNEIIMEYKMLKPTYEEWAKENPIDWDSYDDDEEDGLITEMHYQLYLWEGGMKEE